MAVLSNTDRISVWAAYMADASLVRDPLPAMTKADIRAAVDAVDDWVNTNSSAFNTALPVVARTNLTSRQKASLLTYVVKRRFEVS